MQQAISLIAKRLLQQTIKKGAIGRADENVLTDALGLLGASAEAFSDEVKDKRLPTLGVTREKREQLLQDRLAARAAKEWDRADAIRKELEDGGIMVMDRADGVDWRVRLALREEAEPERADA